jgi:hypothetical protein
LTKTNTGTVGDSGNQTVTNSVWAFNSVTDVNSDKSVDTNGNTRTDNLTEKNSGTVSDQGSQTGSVTNTGTVGNIGSEDTTITNTGTVGNVGSEETSVSNTGTVRNVTDQGGTITNTGTVGTIGSDVTTGTNRRDTDDTTTETGNDHRERSGRHFGNIGNLTSQKMLNEEIELWKWNYINDILEDARQFLTLSVYIC